MRDPLIKGVALAAVVLLLPQPSSSEVMPGPAELASYDFTASPVTNSLLEGSCPLDYHSFFTFRTEHFQDLIRLPDQGGLRYYMGTFSQDTSDDEGGMVFVGELGYGSTRGRVVFCDVLNDKHRGGGFNHPGDLRRIGNTVLIAGQNWGTSRVALDLGNGGQGVLFYDVSDSANPAYMGKLQVCSSDSKTYKTLPSEKGVGGTDSIAVNYDDGWYYLSFNGVYDTSDADQNKKSIVCRSRELYPNVSWEFVREGSYGSPSPVTFTHDGTIYSGFATDGEKDGQDVVFFSTSGLSGSATQIMSVPRSNRSFGDGTTFSLSVIGEGQGSIVYADVESDDGMRFAEVVTPLPQGSPDPASQSAPITDLFLVYGRGQTGPAGYASLPIDLNEGAGGDDIYLWYSRDPSKGAPITDVTVTFERTVPGGYQHFSCNRDDEGWCDVNRDAGGQDIFMFFSRDAAKGAPIKQVRVLSVAQSDLGSQVPSGWNYVHKDLNAGAGGSDLWIAYQR